MCASRRRQEFDHFFESTLLFWGNLIYTTYAINMVVTRYAAHELIMTGELIAGMLGVRSFSERETMYPAYGYSNDPL